MIQLGLTMLVVLGLSGRVSAQNHDPWVGTWKLNPSKSQYEPASFAPRSSTVEIESVAGGGIKTTTNQIDARGQSVHLVTIAMFDGRPVEVNGAAVPTTRAYKRIDSHTYEQLNFVNGVPTTTQRIVTSKDGKTQTVTTIGKNPQGVSINNRSVYERIRR